MRLSRTFVLVVLAILLLPAFFLTMERLDRRRMRAAKHRAIAIAEQLQEHYRTHGVYPMTLDAADGGAPTPPNWGRRRWEYWSDGTNFTLAVRADNNEGYPAVYYDGKAGDGSCWIDQ